MVLKRTWLLGLCRMLSVTWPGGRVPHRRKRRTVSRRRRRRCPPQARDLRLTGARPARARLRGVRSVVTEDAARTHPRDRDPARRGARAHGRPGAHAPAEADRAALRAGDARRLPPAPAGHDRQAGPASRHGLQGRDARELSLVEGGAGDQAQALADGVGGPCPARDQGRDDLGARHRPRRAPVARDPARRAAGARAAPRRPAARCRRRSPATGCGSGSCRRARVGTSTRSPRGRGRPASQPCSSRARTARTMRGRSSTRRWSRPCTRMASTCARGSSSTAPIRSARRRRARTPWRRAPTASSSTPRAATRAATRRRSSTSPRCGPPSDPRIRSG